MTDTFSARQVDGGDVVGGEENAVLAVFCCRPDGEAFATKCLRDLPHLAFKADVGFGRRHGANDLLAVVFRRRQNVGHRSFAWLVAAARYLLVERFMRPLEIVDFAPGVEGALRFGEIAEAAQRKHLGLERAVEALVLAAALWMIRPAVNDADTELE